MDRAYEILSDVDAQVDSAVARLGGSMADDDRDYIISRCVYMRRQLGRLMRHLQEGK